MDATQRIIQEFNRLIALALEPEEVRKLPFAQQVVFFCVVARCDADMGGFASVYEQGLMADDLKVLIAGLRKIDEPKLAAEYEKGLNALTQDGFYEHLNWNKVSENVSDQIDEIGERINSEPWGLDEKLAALLDANPPQ